MNRFEEVCRGLKRLAAHFDESNAKYLRSKRGFESIAARKYRLLHDCWKEIFRILDEKTEFTRDIVWADSERRQTKLFVGAFIGDQQVFRIDEKRFEEICRFLMSFEEVRICSTIRRNSML